jgi:hypothetical protein
MVIDDLAYVKPITCEEDEQEFQKDMGTLSSKYRSIELSLNSIKTA